MTADRRRKVPSGVVYTPAPPREPRLLDRFKTGGRISWHRYSLAVLVVVVGAALVRGGHLDGATWAWLAGSALALYATANTTEKVLRQDGPDAQGPRRPDAEGHPPPSEYP